MRSESSQDVYTGFLFVLTCLLYQTFCSAQTTKPTTAPSPIIGVYSQPASPKWPARGINTFVRWEPENDSSGNPTVPMSGWKKAVASLGCKYICQPSDDPATDAKDPNLLAFLLEPDEPDDKFVDKNMAGDPANLLKRYNALKAAAPSVPVMINFDLWQMQWHKYDYASACKACDWVAGDFYPIIRGDKPEQLGKLLDQLSTYADGRRMLAFVECSFQNLDPEYYHGKRAPTPDELSAIVDQIRSRHADIIYFPQSFRPFSYDAIPDDLVAKMTRINKAIAGGGAK